MDANDINNVINTLFPTSENNQQIFTQTEDINSSETQNISSEDINDILLENGFNSINEQSSDDYSETQEDYNEYNYYQEEIGNNTEASESTTVEEYENDEYNEEEDDEEDDDEDNTELMDTLLGPTISESSENISSDNSSENNIPLITPNSPTLLINETTHRFSGTEWFNEIQKARIILAGVGGIGSNVAFQLARLNPSNITLYDDDNIEAINMAGQLFSTNDIGKSKVSAIADMIHSYTTINQVYAIQSKFTEESETGDIMICGFDNMKARKLFFTSWLYHLEKKTLEERKNCLFIDGRLSIDTLQIFCIQGNDKFNINRYRNEFLFSDDLADITVCSMKQTTYLACMIGSLIVNMFTNFIANTLNPIIPYDLPFFIEYDSQNVIFKTEN